MQDQYLGRNKSALLGAVSTHRMHAPVGESIAALGDALQGLVTSLGQTSFLAIDPHLAEPNAPSLSRSRQI